MIHHEDTAPCPRDPRDRSRGYRRGAAADGGLGAVSPAVASGAHGSPPAARSARVRQRESGGASKAEEAAADRSAVIDLCSDEDTGASIAGMMPSPAAKASDIAAGADADGDAVVLCIDSVTTTVSHRGSQRSAAHPRARPAETTVKSPRQESLLAFFPRRQQGAGPTCEPS